jgi:hypothetical protein
MNVLPVPHLAVPPGAHSESCHYTRVIKPTEQPLLGLLLQLKPASALQFLRSPKAEVSRKGYTGRHAIS